MCVVCVVCVWCVCGVCGGKEFGFDYTGKPPHGSRNQNSNVYLFASLLVEVLAGWLVCLRVCLVDCLLTR